MADPTQYAEKDPRHHTAKLKQMLRDVVEHAREDIGKVTDPRAQALFETTAEVLIGLQKAYQDYEERSEQAWKGAAG
jgi:hypothetical protein